MPTAITVNDVFDILFETILPAVGNLCLFFISVYTFRLTVIPKKLRFIGYKPCFSTFEGDSVEITLENRALSPAVIQHVALVQNGHTITVFSEEDDGACIIDGFKIGTIKMIPFSAIYSHGEQGEEISFDTREPYLVVTTTRGRQYLNFAGSSKKSFLRLKEKLYPIEHTLVKRNYFNGKILKPYVRYAIIYPDKEGNTQTVFVHQSGLMSEVLFGYNGLSEDIVTSKENMYAYFEKEFSKRGISFAIKEFSNADSLIVEYD